MKIYLDGRWVEKNQAKVSVFDHGLLYGDGIFEGLRAYNGHVFRLREHLERLNRSARLISLKVPLSIPALEKIAYEALKKNKLKDSYLRLLVTRGVGNLGLDPRACPRPSVILIADKLALFPAVCYEKGLSAIIAKTRRNLTTALDPSIKSMNYLNNILAKIEAVRHRVPEAIMLNVKGDVCECTGDNIFLINKNTIITPPVSAGVLVGITRSVVMEIVRKQTRYRLQEKPFKPEALFKANEIFFTGTAAEVIPVTTIDRRAIGSGRPGPMTLDIMDRFKTLIRREAAAKP